MKIFKKKFKGSYDFEYVSHCGICLTKNLLLSKYGWLWLNRNQLALLFDRDVKTIGKHINNALKEELGGLSVIANFATTASDGKTYQVEYYNIEMITSIGYRVKSKRGVQFRV